MKRACRVCPPTATNKYHKGYERAHEQSCRVCGGDKQVLGRIEDVNPQYLCANATLHERIVRGFGDDELAGYANPAVARRAKKPSKAQTSWLS